jgi:hypothetical protein
MLDDLRSTAAQSYEEEVKQEVQKPREPRRILGMTAPQRFLVAFLILMMTCVIGAIVLLAAGKVVI